MINISELAPPDLQYIYLLIYLLILFYLFFNFLFSYLLSLHLIVLCGYVILLV